MGSCTCDSGPEEQHQPYCISYNIWLAQIGLTPSADLPACRDEDPAHAATLATCYPDPPDDPPERESTKWTGGDDGV